MSKLTVLSPEGYPPAVTTAGLSAPLDGLKGKTVFLVDVGFENSDNFMRQLQGWLGEHEPSIKTEVVRWADQHRPDPVLSERIRSQGDAAILGVGL
ncbi:MAG: hypothetical protein QOJ43_1656 [Gaiellaceae bacterium]|jgi:hypothetical protein|nr:hypothetical protein [Gaiellaceae bacterium]